MCCLYRKVEVIWTSIGSARHSQTSRMTLRLRLLLCPCRFFRWKSHTLALRSRVAIDYHTASSSFVRDTLLSATPSIQLLKLRSKLLPVCCRQIQDTLHTVISSTWEQSAVVSSLCLVASPGKSGLSLFCCSHYRLDLPSFLQIPNFITFISRFLSSDSRHILPQNVSLCARQLICEHFLNKSESSDSVLFKNTSSS